MSPTLDVDRTSFCETHDVTIARMVDDIRKEMSKRADDVARYANKCGIALTVNTDIRVTFNEP